MPHGLTDADYQRVLARAKEDGNEELVAVVQTAEEIVALLEFDHLQNLFGLKMALAEAQRKVESVEIFLKGKLDTSEP